MMKHLFFLSTAVLFVLFNTLVNAQVWSETQKIVAPDRKASQHFSKSVDISGAYAIVGAHREDTDANGQNPLPKAGAAYIYQKQSNGSWIEIQKIVASDRNAEDNFGTSISLDGNTAVVGAYKRDETDSLGTFLYQAGAVYVFTKDTNGQWNEDQKLLASDMDSLNYFGKSVSISGDYMIIGAAFKNAGNTSGIVPEAGAAYLFERDNFGTWHQKQKLIANDFEAFAIFGWSVAIDGNYAVVGAYKEDKDENGLQTKTDAGAAYVFEKINDTWIQVKKLVASDRNQSDWFGYNVSISGDYIVVGAYQEDEDINGNTTLPNSGSAYIFKRDLNGNWNEVQKIVASDRNSEDWYGYALDIKNDYIVVGARQQDEDITGGNSLSNSGAAYIYHKDNSGVWTEVQKIVASDRGQDDWFGFSVGIDTNTCIVGAFSDKEDAEGNNPLVEAGSAYLFELNNTTTGIYSKKNSENIIIYPNPTKDIISIHANEQELKIIKIYNSLGQDVSYLTKQLSKTDNSVIIDLSKIHSGIYSIRTLTAVSNVYKE